MLEKLLTPVPPVQVQVVFQETVLPLKLIMFEHCDPEVAPPSPHKSRKRVYEPAVTVSHWPQ